MSDGEIVYTVIVVSPCVVMIGWFAKELVRHIRGECGGC